MHHVYVIIRGIACRMFIWAAAPLAMLAITSSAFGPEGMTMCVGQAALSVLMLEAANYVQHYGLQRCRLPNGRYVSENWGFGMGGGGRGQGSGEGKYGRGSYGCTVLHVVKIFKS